MATYEVHRSITIDADPTAVYPRIADFRQWDAWSPWEKLDPNMTKTYTGPESGTGASYLWEGNRKVGEGSMTITGAEPDRRVTIDLQFLKPFKSRSETVLALEPVDGKTRVDWTMAGVHTMMSRLICIFRPMDKLVGPDLEKGLAKLKAITET